jgi:hypothetical protein
MSDIQRQPDLAAALGNVQTELARAGTHFLFGLQRETVLVIAMLVLVLVAAWYVAGTAIPLALGIINDGHRARDDAHTKDLEKVTAANSRDLDKVIAAFKESSDQSQKHNREMIDMIERALKIKPIAVNPLEVGS